MNISNEIIRALGMTLIHSLWQGAVIAILVMLLLPLLARKNANTRYAILYTGLMLMLISFIATFITLYDRYYLSNVILTLNTTPEAVTNSMATAAGITYVNPVVALIVKAAQLSYPFLALGWIIGFLIMSVKMAGGIILSRTHIRKKLELPGKDIQDRFNQLKNAIVRQSNVILRVTLGKLSPMVIGFFRPMIILPVSAVTGMSISQIEAVIIHELAHIKRYDHIMIVFQIIAEQLLFFNPATWMLIREINNERENCCDDMVININKNPFNYIKALTMIQEMNIKNVAPANKLAGRSNQLLKRIKRLLKPETKSGSHSFRIFFILFLSATLGISAITMAFTRGIHTSGIFSGKPYEETLAIDEVQPDANNIVSGSYEVTAADDNPKDKKKMKIIFENDTIKELTVNGKPVKKEDMDQYKDEIAKIQKELKETQMELQKTDKELEKAQQELQSAQDELEDVDHDLLFSEFSEINQQRMKDFQAQAEAYRQQWEEYRNSEEFQNEMERAREEAEKYRQYWDQHQQEFMEQMRESMKVFRENLEDMQLDGVPLPPFPELPEVPYVEPPDYPDYPDVEIQESPEILPDNNPGTVVPEPQQNNDGSQNETLPSRLLELEEDV